MPTLSFLRRQASNLIVVKQWHGPLPGQGDAVFVLFVGPTSVGLLNVSERFTQDLRVARAESMSPVELGRFTLCSLCEILLWRAYPVIPVSPAAISFLVSGAPSRRSTSRLMC